MRVTESLGGQHVQAPDVTGEPERPATLMLRRLQLDVGSIAHLPAPSPADVVLAQSPPPNTAGSSGPQVALLVSDDQTGNDTAAYIMPALGGMSVATANARLATVGLHIGSAIDPSLMQTPAPGAATPGGGSPGSTQPGASQPGAGIPGTAVAGTSAPRTTVPGTTAPGAPVSGTAGLTPDPAIPVTVTPPPQASPNAIINSQSPAPGRRVTRGETIRVTVLPSVATDDSAVPMVPGQTPQ